jgi:hypothetical protein
MAGEKKGKAYEALLHIALSELVANKKLAGPLHWNITPKGMSIEPDFLTGKDENQPDTFLLVTYSGSAKESEKKMWRNLGELVEAKTVLDKMPRVYALTFGSIKNELEPIQQHAFDHFVWVRGESHSWADDLDCFISTCVAGFPKGKEAQIIFINDALKVADSKEKHAFRALKLLLESMYKIRSEALDRMWSNHRSRTVPAAPSARNTYLRRGTSKARIFENLDDAYWLYKGKPIDSLKFPRYIYDLGLANSITLRGKGFAKPTDEEIGNAVKLLEIGVFKSVTKKLQSEKVTEYLNSLRNLDRYGAIAEYVSKEFHNLSNPKKLAEVIRKLHRDPGGVNLPGETPTSWPPNSVWILPFLFDLVRSHGNSGNYGISQLGRDVVQAGYGSPSDINSANQFGGGFGLSAWIDRKPESGFREDLIDGVAFVFARYISEIGLTSARSAMLGIKDSAAKTLIETKLVTYKTYEPLYELLKIQNPKVKKVAVSSCFGERASSRGRAGHTSLAVIEKTLVNWQSAHGSHTNDKKKELCGRAIGLRYHWNGKTFVRRPGVEKMILVLDGTWKQADLNALLRAGWDEIYYPDEMDQLAKAIV